MANTTGQDDILLNWTGSLQPDMRSETERVAELMDRKLAEGISISSAVEIIAGAGYPIETVKRVAEARRRQILASTREKAVDPQQAPSPPANYADVEGHIHKIVMGMSPDDAITVLSGRTKNSPALVRLTEKERPKFRSVVAVASQVGDERTLGEVDRWVGPYVETAIVDSEILAKKLAEDEHTAVDDNGDGTYVVQDSEGHRSAVDLGAMSCTCSRYVFGSFAHTGLACEHILHVTAVTGEGS